MLEELKHYNLQKLNILIGFRKYVAQNEKF